MIMSKTDLYSRFTKRVMRLTRWERRFVNSPANAQRVMRVAAPLLERAVLPPRARWLEIGCGQGAVTRLLVERYDAQVVATDYDPAQVALAQERLADLGQQTAFRVVDARKMPFDDAQFDGVIAFQVMHHIPAGWRQVVAEIARTLRPGGWFVITDVIVSPRAGRLMKRWLPWLDQLEETALHACLAEASLHLTHYERKPGMLMGNCAAVARRS
jgi:ubiquinone/menaquinone biosynthesis C-methylase UbiE